MHCSPGKRSKVGNYSLRQKLNTLADDNLDHANNRTLHQGCLSSLVFRALKAKATYTEQMQIVFQQKELKTNCLFLLQLSAETELKRYLFLNMSQHSSCFLLSLLVLEMCIFPGIKSVVNRTDDKKSTKSSFANQIYLKKKNQTNLEITI